MPATLASPEFARTVLAFCAAIAAARRLVTQGEMGARLSAQLDYAASSLDAIDLQLVEAALPADAPQRATAARVRERFERLLLRLATSSLRRRALRASRRAARAHPASGAMM
jgi:hypothetical protein